MTRSRLSPEQRRAQLLELGARLFAAAPYDEVHIERVAELAGVSRGLLYHYFPTKRSFFAELVRDGLRRMAEATEPDPTLSPLDQLVRGVEQHLDHVCAHPHVARALYRGAASADAEVQQVIAESFVLFERRIVDVLEPDREAAEVVGLAVRSWTLLMRALSQELIDHPAVPRAQVRDVAVSAFVAMLVALPPDLQPARVQELVAEGVLLPGER